MELNHIIIIGFLFLMFITIRAFFKPYVDPTVPKEPEIKSPMAKYERYRWLLIVVVILEMMAR